MKLHSNAKTTPLSFADFETEAVSKRLYTSPESDEEEANESAPDLTG